MQPLRTLLIFAVSRDNSTFSYQRAWPRHFRAHPAFACTPIDLLDGTATARLRTLWRAKTFRGDAVVLLHSAFSNACLVPAWLIDALASLPQPKVYFIGNEYKLMPEKMAFCDRLGLTMLVSQSQSERIHALYRDRLECDVIGIPNTGLDPDLFRPSRAAGDRPIDLGYRAADAPAYLGHRERRDMAEFFQANAARYGLTVDISLSGFDRFTEPEWAAFLNRCKGQLGTEAGGDYFDLEDSSRHAVHRYTEEHPAATFEEIEGRFFRDRPKMPLRILSGRQVEAAGTKTAQILFEGDYDGLFLAHEHYIPLKKDFSDADEAIARFADPGERSAMADRAYAHVRDRFTYDRLLDGFHAELVRHV